MSEKQEIKFEGSEEHNASERHEVSKPKAEAAAEVAKSHKAQAEQLKQARELVQEESSEKDKTALDKLKVEQAPAEDDISKRPVSSSLKQTAFATEIKYIRQKLSTPDKLGSKVIHQPIIRSLSNVSSKTITRPSGLLGGGVVAFLGTSTYLYLTKHIGLKYNYSVFLFLLVAGFVIGLVLEAVIRLARGRRSI